MENKTSKKIFLVMFICFMILASFNIIKVEGACTTPADEVLLQQMSKLMI